MALTGALECLATAINKFMTQFGAYLNTDSDGNMCWSPPGIFSLLSLLYDSASGGIAEKLAILLNVENTEAAIADCEMLTNLLITFTDLTFVHGSAIFVKDIEVIGKDFIKNAGKFYDTTILPLQYDKKGRAYKSINAWVENKPTGKIEESFISNDFKQNLQLMILSGCYWRADWLEKFEYYEVKKDVFTVSDKETIRCRMIKLQCAARYADRDDISAQLLCIPFKDPRCGFLMILPRPRISLKEVERKMLGKDLHYIYERLRTSPMVVSLPKLRAESTIDLRSTLTKLGYTELFDGNGAFRGIFQINSRFKVDGFLQKIVVETGEKGTKPPKIETVKNANTPAAPNVPQNRSAFNANRPFMFYIIYHDRKSFFPLVVGRVVKPV
ncbi:Serpin (serine protease inhibitor) [Popillia japonica]|uniref:Serpin (Serine protease inhibitor) n=1 Tax=Popillia japonica TaxID=7064 RepID=A0AAW1MIG6_POPJA